MPASHEAVERGDPDADGLAVIDVLNSVLKTVEDEFALEGTSRETAFARDSIGSDAADSVLTPLAQSEEEKSDTGKAVENATSTGRTLTPPDDVDPDTFKLKTVHFGSHKFAIVTQNLNGPCPLIALVNVLVLKGHAKLPSSGYVSRDALTHLVADTLLQMRPDNMNNQVECNYNRNLEDVINLLPDLGRGLDVNIRFRHVTDFEFTPALSLFDLLRINLYHGWLPDPQFVEIKNAIGELTYNQLVERICDENDPSRFLLEEFLGENISQLTYHGLVALMEAMRDGELAVLFRNNHFHTIHRRKDLLYLLVSDSGYVNEPGIVWESFNTVDGSSLFFDGDFKVSSLSTTTSNESQAICSTEADFLLAQEMQACEDELARQEAEREKARHKEVPSPTESFHTPSSAASSQSYERPSYKGERTVVTNSGPKEKKCTIS